MARVAMTTEKRLVKRNKKLVLPRKSRKKKAEKKFDYCVGYPSENPQYGLRIYSYRGDVRRGTMKEAKAFLKYVRKNTDSLVESKKYAIYKVEFTKVE